MTIGSRIKKCRLSFHWNQKELSKRLNLSPRMISFYERDERVPPADILIKLSQTFHVSVDYLLGLSTETLYSVGLEKPSLSPDEETFLSIFRNLNSDYKDIVLGELKKCMKLQEQEHFLNSYSAPHQKKQA